MFRTIFSKLVAIFAAILLVSFLTTGVMLYRLLGDYTSSQKVKVLEYSGSRITEMMQVWLESRYNPVLASIIEKIVKQNLQAYSYSTSSSIWVIDTRGIIVYAFSPNGEDNSYEGTQLKEEEYKEVLQGKPKKSIGGFPFPGNVSYLTIQLPLFSKENKVLGAVFLHTEMPELQRVSRDVLRFFAQSVFISITIAMILIYFFSRRITKPLKEISHAARIISHGQFQKKLEVKSNDEIGELAESFNNMSAALENLENMRRSFIANVSHELRTPMTSIRGFIEGILDGTVSEEKQKDYLVIVKEEVNRLNRLVNDLLDLAKMEAGELKLSIRPFDINELMRRTIIKLETYIVDKNIEIEANFQEESLIALGDVDSIERVLINLLHNAIKFTGTNGRITLETNSAKGKVYVAVQDDGIGIPPDEIKNIWDRFYKSDKSRGKDKSGTGLGLSIVKNIIQEHGQEINVESEPNKGTRFTFSLDLQSNL